MSYVGSICLQLLPVAEHVRLWLNNVRAWLLPLESVTGEEWENTLSAVQVQAIID